MRAQPWLAALGAALLSSTPYATVPHGMMAMRDLDFGGFSSGGTAHKTRRGGERAHRRWRQRRSSGKAA